MEGFQMLFNSLHFLIFFPIVTTTYFLLPHRYRWFLLLAASCYFYMAFIPAYILILFITITVDYLSGILIERSSGRKKLVFLMASILTNCGMLFFFKYFNFFNHLFASFTSVAGFSYPVSDLSILLPIGLSFHTFQSLSYVIEVFRGRQKAERSYGVLSLYVLFFPQLVAGPIERPYNLLHQFREEHAFEYNRIVSGLQLMIWGLFKKIVIADRLSSLVDPVYNYPSEFQGFPVIVATLAFTFQIFCDFSGYSDMAIGAARVLGFKLMENFRCPYFADSIPEFWRRWHISLSTWFKDYLYIPLGGNRIALPRWCFNIFVVFLVSGLWHGANWTFVAWGGLHGLYFVISRLTASIRRKTGLVLGSERFPSIWRGFRVLVTFVFVSIAWVFFRANSLEDAFLILARMPQGLGSTFSLKVLSQALQVSAPLILFTFAMILFLQIAEAFRERISVRERIIARPLWMRWSLYYAFLSIIILFGRFDASPFIYFQF